MYQVPKLLEEFFQDTLVVFKESIATWEGFEHFLPKIDYLQKNLAEIGKRSYRANKPGQGYNVLNHGDFHLRNILFKTNEQKRLEDFYFVSQEHFE